MAEILRDELVGDPKGLGYPVSDQGAADLINSLTTGRTRNRTSMSGDEVFSNIENKAVWDALTVDQRREFLLLCSREILDPFSIANVDLIKSVFGNASVTVSNFSTARIETISRATELGLGVVKARDVGYARN